MENLQFDSGVRTYRVNGGEKLTFNPSDPNLYSRFRQAEEKLLEMEKAMEQQEGDVLQVMLEMDQELKKLFTWVFPGNDFEKIFDGIHLLAVTKTGKTVLENFLEALTPILCQGAESYASALADAASKGTL